MNYIKRLCFFYVWCLFLENVLIWLKGLLQTLTALFSFNQKLSWNFILVGFLVKMYVIQLIAFMLNDKKIINANCQQGSHD